MWWRCPVLPRGPIGLLRYPFITIDGPKANNDYIVVFYGDLKTTKEIKRKKGARNRRKSGSLFFEQLLEELRYRPDKSC